MLHTLFIMQRDSMSVAKNNILNDVEKGENNFQKRLFKKK